MQIFGVTGESLGTIGVREEPKKTEPEPEPEWKRMLDARPSVSVRRGIAWVSGYLS
jgi:hypothetical protein